MPDSDKPNPLQEQVDRNIVKIEPGTLVLIIGALILLPLLFTGFFAQ
ncbi:hypothetical protein ACN4EK_08150 [Pantanalinema rosaneae CENA516]